MKSNVSLAEFKVETDLGTQHSKELYANNRHQCKLYVRVAKQVENELGGWDIVPLTIDEKNSVTIKEYSTNPNVGLPQGWACDTDKNIYDSGLWPPQVQEWRSDDTTSNHTSSAPVELIGRYMRFADNYPIETKRFMASIAIDGRVYTTNYSDDDSSFQSYVDITPFPPRLIKAAQLQIYADSVAYDDQPNNIYGAVYYWQFPEGVRALESLGLTLPLNIQNEGTHFHTAFVFFDLKGGVVTGKSALGSTLHMSEIQRGVYPDLNPEVEFNLIETPMKAVVLTYPSGMSYAESKGVWRVIDSFGTVQQYRLLFGHFNQPPTLTD